MWFLFMLRGKLAGDSMCKVTLFWVQSAFKPDPQALLGALDGPLMSVVSRAGVSRHPPTLAEGWTPFELGDDRRAPPLPAEGRLIGISRDLSVSRATVRKVL